MSRPMNQLMRMAQIGMREGRRRRLVDQREAEKSITEINRCRRGEKGAAAAVRMRWR